MSTIQTQVNLVHLQSGVPVPSVTQRTSFGSQFAANVISVGTTDETIPLGDITTPKQVMVKLISGDLLRIGLDGTTYPFELVDLDESTLFRLAVEGIVETSTIETTADIGGSLSDTFFVVTDRNGETWGIGFGTFAYSLDHEVSSATDPTGLSAAEVAADLYASMSAFGPFLEFFTPTYDDAVNDTLIALTDKFPGTRTNIADTGSTGFTLTTTQQGAASPVIHLKSTGTSQVVVAVAPH